MTNNPASGGFISPVSRPEVADPRLSRPDWTGGGRRDPRLLWLDKNENCDPALNSVVAGIVAALPPQTFFSYPASADLYAKLAAWIGCRPGNLLLAAGSDGVIRSVFEAYVSPGDVVVHTVPTFAMYSVYSRVYGATVAAMDYRATDRGPALDAGEMIRTIAAVRPRLVCLPNPDSPTGTVLAPDQIEAVIAAAGKAGALMLVDEAYHPFHRDSVVRLIDRFPHLVVARSTGKAWGMAGLRIGYAVAPPEVAVHLHKVRPMYEASTVGMAVFERMLDHAAEMEASVARLRAGKQTFLAAMAPLGLNTLDGAGNFLHVAFGRRADEVHAALVDLVYYRHDFSEPCLKGFSRFSSTTPELFAPVIERIGTALRA